MNDVGGVLADLDELPMALVQRWECVRLDGVHQWLVVSEDDWVSSFDLGPEMSACLLYCIEFESKWRPFLLCLVEMPGPVAERPPFSANILFKDCSHACLRGVRC